MARALRKEMGKSLDLPSEDCFQYTGPDWLLNLLTNISKDIRGLVLMMLWQCWHLRNDAAHAKGDASIEALSSYLECYLQELNLNWKISVKGKIKI